MESYDISSSVTSPPTVEIPRLLTSLSEISASYDLLICDVWGVLHDGVRVSLEAVEALRRARAGGLKVALASNSQKGSRQVEAELAALGIESPVWDIVVTSGDATRRLLKSKAQQSAHLISSRLDCATLEAWPINKAALEEADFLFAVSLPEGATPADFRATLEHAASRGLDLVCANPDIRVRVGHQLQWCAGALAEAYADLGGAVVMAGKPFAPIYELVFRSLRRLALDRVLAIGDAIPTDVKGANMLGADCILITEGVHKETLSPTGQVDMALVRAALTAQDARCAFVMERLS